MTTRILEECHETFVSCFHAFYPTAYLKWISLCDLLALVDKVSVYAFLKGIIRGLLEKYPTFGREKETGLLGALDT